MAKKNARLPDPPKWLYRVFMVGEDSPFCMPYEGLPEIINGNEDKIKHIDLVSFEWLRAQYPPGFFEKLKAQVEANAKKQAAKKTAKKKAT